MNLRAWSPLVSFRANTSKDHLSTFWEETQKQTQIQHTCWVNYSFKSKSYFRHFYIPITFLCCYIKTAQETVYYTLIYIFKCLLCILYHSTLVSDWTFSLENTLSHITVKMTVNIYIYICNKNIKLIKSWSDLYHIIIINYINVYKIQK